MNIINGEIIWETINAFIQPALSSSNNSNKNDYKAQSSNVQRATYSFNGRRLQLKFESLLGSNYSYDIIKLTTNNTVQIHPIPLAGHDGY